MFMTLSGWSHIDHIDNHAYSPYGDTSSFDCVRIKIPKKKNVTENKPLD